MKLKNILVILVIIALVGIAGCGEEKTQTITTPSTDSAQPAAVEKTEAPSVPAKSPPPKREVTMEDVDLKTSDGINLKGTYYKGTTNQGVILLHMLNKKRATWKEFAKDLQDTGYHVIAIDFRGHGDSDGDWDDFSSNEFEDRNDFVDMEYDVAAAAAFLKKKATWPKTIIGASIGANIALRYAANTPEVEKVVLMSPGLSYKGVRTNEASMAYHGEVLMVGSTDDVPYVEANEKLNNKFVGKHKTFEYMGSGHGTDLFKLESGLSARIIGWLEE